MPQDNKSACLKKPEKSVGAFINKIDGIEYKYRDEIGLTTPINEFKAVASFNEAPHITSSPMVVEFDQQKDLAYGSCIYVSEGENSNGAYFLRQELIKARKTPRLKPVDIEHNPDIIVGNIYDSYLVTQGGDVIDESSVKYDSELNEYRIIDKEGNEINDKLDIKTNFVIYKYMFPAVANEISEHQLSSINSKYFVSMEVFYNEYGYVFDRDPSTFVKVEDNLAGQELKNRYDQYINKQAPDGRHVSIAYLNFIFSAVGITEKPANQRSYLLDLATKKQEHNSNPVVDSDAQGTDTHTHTNLDEDKSFQEEEMTNEQKAALEKLVNKAMASDPDLSADEARLGVLNTRIETLTSDNGDLSVKLDTASDKITVMSEEAEKVSTDYAAKEEEFKADIASKDVEIDKLTKELASANEKLSSIEQEKLGSDRIMELETAGVKFGDRRDSVISRVSKMSTEDYGAYKEDMVGAVSAVAAKKEEMEDDKKDKDGKDKKKDEKYAKKDDKTSDDKKDKASDDGEEGEGDDDGADAPDLSTDKASAEDFNSATASASNADVSKDYSNLLEGVFKTMTTRTKDSKRGRNTVF